MGYTALQKLSIIQIQRRIQHLSKDSANIFVTDHAKKCMKQRGVTIAMVFDCLRNGRIYRTPEPNDGKGNLECLMEHYCSGVQCSVVAAISDEAPDVICVTLWQ